MMPLPLRLRAPLACLPLLLSACALPSSPDVAPSPEQPWKPDGNVWQQPGSGVLSAAASAAADTDHKRFSIPAVPDLPALQAGEFPQDGKALSLPQLIDIAQRQNPETRLAWNRAREAAMSVGLTDALFLPSITASVIAGHQRLNVPVQLPLNLGQAEIDNKVRGTTPMLTLTWLLFDFGERRAIREGAQYAALSANILFNATHQKIIRDVTDAYYRHSAARTSAALARQSLRNHEHVLEAVTARMQAGLATRIDIALARQALAQGRLDLVTREGLERTSYLALLQALGMPPDTRLEIAAPALDQLPSSAEPLTRQRIESVIAQRADIAAAYAAVRMADAGKRAAEAAFMPKVYMGAALARNHSNFQAGNLSGLGVQNTASGVLFGVSVPLYDAGLRSTQLHKAEVAREQAQLQLQRLQMTAVREIVAAQQALDTALQSHDAAQELVQTASVAHDAALESYKMGRSSTVLLTESATQLNKALQAQADARYAAMAAAANLAFVMGTLVTDDADWMPAASAAPATDAAPAWPASPPQPVSGSQP